MLLPTFSSPAATLSSSSGSASLAPRWLSLHGSQITWWRSLRCRQCCWSTWSTWPTATATQLSTTASPTPTSVWWGCCWTQVSDRKKNTVNNPVNYSRRVQQQASHPGLKRVGSPYLSSITSLSVFFFLSPDFTRLLKTLSSINIMFFVW